MAQNTLHRPLSLLHNASDRSGSGPALAKRPKLSLQTDALDSTARIFSNALAAKSSNFAKHLTSPTIRNTFSNTYNISASPTRLVIPFSPTRSSPKKTHGSSRARVAPASAPCEVKAKYQVPAGIASILHKTPLREEQQSWRRGQKKAVSFDTPLATNIRTQRYTYTHYDVLQEDQENDRVTDLALTPTSPSSPHAPMTASASTLSSACDVHDDGNARLRHQQSEMATWKSKPKPAGDNPRGDSPLEPARPVARNSRTKKRKWVWTLGPLAEDEADALVEEEEQEHDDDSATTYRPIAVPKRVRRS